MRNFPGPYFPSTLNAGYHQMSQAIHGFDPIATHDSGYHQMPQAIPGSDTTATHDSGYHQMPQAIPGSDTTATHSGYHQMPHAIHGSDTTATHDSGYHQMPQAIPGSDTTATHSGYHQIPHAIHGSDTTATHDSGYHQMPQALPGSDTTATHDSGYYLISTSQSSMSFSQGSRYYLLSQTPSLSATTLTLDPQYHLVSQGVSYHTPEEKLHRSAPLYKQDIAGTRLSLPIRQKIPGPRAPLLGGPYQHSKASSQSHRMMFTNRPSQSKDSSCSLSGNRSNASNLHHGVLLPSTSLGKSTVPSFNGEIGQRSSKVPVNSDIPSQSVSMSTQSPQISMYSGFNENIPSQEYYHILYERLLANNPKYQQIPFHDFYIGCIYRQRQRIESMRVTQESSHLHTSTHSHLPTSTLSHLHTSTHSHLHTSSNPRLHASVHPYLQSSSHLKSSSLQTFTNPHLQSSTTYLQTSSHLQTFPYLCVSSHPHISTPLHSSYAHSHLQTSAHQQTSSHGHLKTSISHLSSHTSSTHHPLQVSHSDVRPHVIQSDTKVLGKWYREPDSVEEITSDNRYEYIYDSTSMENPKSVDQNQNLANIYLEHNNSSEISNESPENRTFDIVEKNNFPKRENENQVFENNISVKTETLEISTSTENISIDHIDKQETVSKKQWCLSQSSKKSSSHSGPIKLRFLFCTPTKTENSGNVSVVQDWNLKTDNEMSEKCQQKRKSQNELRIAKRQCQFTGKDKNIVENACQRTIKNVNQRTEENTNQNTEENENTEVSTSHGVEENTIQITEKNMSQRNDEITRQITSKGQCPAENVSQPMVEQIVNHRNEGYVTSTNTVDKVNKNKNRRWSSEKVQERVTGKVTVGLKYKDERMLDNEKGSCSMGAEDSCTDYTVMQFTKKTNDTPSKSDILTRSPRQRNQTNTPSFQSTERKSMWSVPSGIFLSSFHSHLLLCINIGSGQYFVMDELLWKCFSEFRTSQSDLHSFQNIYTVMNRDLKIPFTELSVYRDKIEMYLRQNQYKSDDTCLGIIQISDAHRLYQYLHGFKHCKQDCIYPIDLQILDIDGNISLENNDGKANTICPMDSNVESKDSNSEIVNGPSKIIKGGLAPLFGSSFRYIVMDQVKYFPYVDFKMFFKESLLHQCLKEAKNSSCKINAFRCSEVEASYLNRLDPFYPVIEKNAPLLEEKLLFKAWEILKEENSQTDQNGNIEIINGNVKQSNINANTEMVDIENNVLVSSPILVKSSESVKSHESFRLLESISKSAKPLKRMEWESCRNKGNKTDVFPANHLTCTVNAMSVPSAIENNYYDNRYKEHSQEESGLDSRDVLSKEEVIESQITPIKPSIPNNACSDWCQEKNTLSLRDEQNSVNNNLAMEAEQNYKSNKSFHTAQSTKDVTSSLKKTVLSMVNSVLSEKSKKEDTTAVVCEDTEDLVCRCQKSCKIQNNKILSSLLSLVEQNLLLKEEKTILRENVLQLQEGTKTLKKEYLLYEEKLRKLQFAVHQSYCNI